MRKLLFWFGVVLGGVLFGINLSMYFVLKESVECYRWVLAVSLILTNIFFINREYKRNGSI